MEQKVANFVFPSDEKAFEAAVGTTEFLAQHTVRDNVKPISDEIFTGAHGELIYLKICAALAEGSTIVKIQALEKSNDLVRDAGNVVHAVEKGMFSELLLNLGDWDIKVRQLSSQAIVHCTSCNYGRDHALGEENTAVMSVAKLLNDSDDQVKLNGYKIFLNLAQVEHGLEQILEYNLVDKFILKILQETDTKVKAKCLEVLGTCLKFEKGEGYEKAMEANVVGTLKVALGSATAPELQAAICKVYAYIAYNMDGKDAIVECGAAPLIIKLLPSKNIQVRIAASSAISYITIALSGKVVVVDMSNGVDMLVDGTADKNDIIAVNCMQSLANVAEHPKAKAAPILLNEETLQKLKTLTQNPNPLVARAASLCIKKITWKP